MFPAYAFCAGRWGQTFNELEALNGGLFEYIYIYVCVCVCVCVFQISFAVLTGRNCKNP